MTPDPAEFNVKIARFTNLRATTVAETYSLTWDAWLTYLTDEPADEFRGQMLHPGWSPVLFNPPTREAAHVQRIYALVLDYDKHADWDRVHMLWVSHYGAMYTTKSHRDDAHRFRVVMPLSRPVSRDEYAKIWSWAAERSSAAGFPTDTQCRDSSRFWYDPSRPDGTWRSERLPGAVLDPEPVLALPDPEPVRLRVVPPATPLRQDERTKRASAYLAKIPGAVEGDSGHTATFNAVAAVMFGFDLDESTTRALIWNEYNPRCDPPWSEKEIDHKIANVAARCTRDRGYLLTDRRRIVDTAHASRAVALPPDVSVDWRSEIRFKSDNVTGKRLYLNTLAFVRHHPDYRGKWSLNEMTAAPHFEDGPMSDLVVHEVRAAIERHLGYTPSPADTLAAISACAAERKFHPIRQYLKSVDWDGTPRLRSMARDFLGSDSELHAEMVEKFMIGAARRAIEPGVKLDTALMLVGAQGIGKSTFFAVLGGDWHADSFVDITNKDSFVQIHSAWIYELAELENVVTGKAESRLKAWLTSTHDTFRAPYARTAQRHARAVVMCGTTNRGQFITDDTGSRRFWIVPVECPIDRVLLSGLRDQLWAEAYSAAERGASWWLSADADRARELASDEHREHDEWHDPIALWLSRPDRMEVTVGEILEQVIDIKIAFQDRSAQQRVAKVLALLRWDRVREGQHPRRWKYIKPKSQGELL